MATTTKTWAKKTSTTSKRKSDGQTTFRGPVIQSTTTRKDHA